MPKNSNQGWRSGTPDDRARAQGREPVRTQPPVGYHSSVVGAGPFGELSAAEAAMLRRAREREAAEREARRQRSWRRRLAVVLTWGAVR